MKKFITLIVLVLTLTFTVSLFAARYLVVVKCTGGRILRMYLYARNIHEIRTKFAWEASRRGCYFAKLRYTKRVSK